jgi:hypothetical protein
MKRFKYCRTFHFPWSPGVASDDKIFYDYENFFKVGDKVIVTVKMDGENSCLYSDGYTHARSIDSAHHVSREWLKNFWAQKHYELPEGWRIYGENLYAKHSIEYTGLKSYFVAFSIFDSDNRRLDWDEFVEWCNLLDIQHVNVVDSFVINDWNVDMQRIQKLFYEVVSNGGEGIVVTSDAGHTYDSFGNYLIKAVRANHVTTEEHWMHGEIVKNGLAS